MNSIGTDPRNHYDVLEVSQRVSPEVLRAAYKSLIQRYHPDRNPDDASAAERSARVVKAYQVLANPEARTAYDLELRKQSDNLERLNIRRRAQSASAATHSKVNEFRWVFWVPVALLAMFLWFFGAAWFQTPPLPIEPRVIASLPDDQWQKDNDQIARVAARTIPNFIENLSVPLDSVSSTGDVTQRNSKRILSIRTIGLVAGGFDPEKFIQLLKSSKDYISRKLSERLASADYDMLVNKDGDRYLKQLILDSIGEITNTKRPERDTSAANSFGTHYGAVEVLLPDSFIVESQSNR